jgi:tetratricopeptide (TPR) repeat protein
MIGTRAATSPASGEPSSIGHAVCSRLLTSNPRNAVAYSNRGGAYYLKGDYHRAMADFDQAIKLDPKLALAYYDRGYAYNNKGDHERAIADLDRAITLNPKWAAGS